jgi:hypothetical protein
MTPSMVRVEGTAFFVTVNFYKLLSAEMSAENPKLFVILTNSL